MEINATVSKREEALLNQRTRNGSRALDSSKNQRDSSALEGEAEVTLAAFEVESRAVQNRSEELEDEKKEQERAKKLKSEERARELELELKKTTVQFKVSFNDKNSEDMKFSIVNAETGEIIREFPPGEFDKVIEQARKSEGLGNILDEIV